MKKNLLYVLILLFILLGIFGAKIGIENLIIFILAGIFMLVVLAKYETITYILALYPFLDFGFRNFMPSLASIWDELLFLSMFAIWGYKYLIYRKENTVKQTPLDMPVILFIIAMIAVFIFNSPDYRISLEGLRAVIQYILWYFVIIQLLKDEQSAKNICLVFILIVSIMSLHSVYQFIIGVENPSHWTDSKEAGVRTRVFSILTSPNILGSLVALAIPICLSFVFIAKKMATKLIYLFFAMTMVATLLFTFSRGAWIGFAGGICLYVFLKDKRLFIPVIILGVVAIILVPGVGNRIAYLLSPEYIESSLRGGRLVRWADGLKIFSYNPIFGVGLGHFGGAVAMNNGLTYPLGLQNFKTYYMDNYYLKTAVETGIFGLLAFLMLMYQVLLNGIRTINITKSKDAKELEIGILAGLFAVIIHNLVENVFEVPMMTSCFWLLVAVLMHLWYINYNKSKDLANA